MNRNGRCAQLGYAALSAVFVCAGLAHAQTAAPNCVLPTCVTRSDDDAAAPQPGTLRYAILNAPDGAAITFAPGLVGQTLTLDSRSPGNQIKVSRSISVQGPGSSQLTIAGGHATRIFFITGGNVQISDVTLTDGLASGGDGGPGSGGAGGGGAAAGLGGAIFVNSGSVTLTRVILTGNRARGGNGGGGGSGFGPGRGGGGGGFGGASAHGPIGGIAGELSVNGIAEGAGGTGGSGDGAASPGGTGGWGAGGGGGGYYVHAAGGRGAAGGSSDFGGGSGGGGAFLDAEGGAIAGGGGLGGSALGGAIFVRSGQVILRDTAFVNNAAVGGLGGSGAAAGVGKGGALFICSSYFCGPGHDGAALIYGNTYFKSSTAAQAGEDPLCSGRDDRDVCGVLKAGENESKR